ncbi:RWD domain-containing protein 3 [Plakobranchus ocellatus]|uniref:RWD domain-containing protein 3 n=1 Tax=Plakobranchus ocellatus TaxID=259542 RepID=A0AAV3Y672_9GAST|nr:RWD domain-containing protein 3 [Plakobranchus ocellatus]
MASNEDQAFEVDALKLIYCKDGEVRDSEVASGKRILVELDFTHLGERFSANNIHGKLEFLLPHDYPQQSPPSISITCKSLCPEVIESVKNALKLRANDMLGESMLLDLICLAKELLEHEITNSLLLDSPKKSSAKEKAECDSFSQDAGRDAHTLPKEDKPCEYSYDVGIQNSPPCVNADTPQRSLGDVSEANSTNMVTSLLHLDHMRSKTSYTKLIRRWAGELSLTGRLFFCQRAIFILLQGDVKNIKEYIVRNRTTSVDVDSRGKACKERMLSVLCEASTAPNQTLREFTVVEISPQELHLFFKQHFMEDMYEEHVKPLLQGFYKSVKH